jgi:hypothetical protein
LKRFATVVEVAAMVTYLAGEHSSATNGAALRVSDELASDGLVLALYQSVVPAAASPALAELDE